jgi:hypothetical protein
MSTQMTPTQVTPTQMTQMAPAQSTGEAQDASVVPLRMPRAEGLPPAAPEDGRNPLFSLLVRNEGDLPGLLAYALYKQNKRNWLRAFEEVMGRPPTAEETQAFILGERLPARVEAYRRLADEMLARRDRAESVRPRPDMVANDGQGAARAAGAPAAPTAADVARRISWRQLGLLLLLVVGMAGLFRLLGAWLFRP